MSGLSKEVVLRIAKKYCQDDGLVVETIPDPMIEALREHKAIRGINDGEPSPKGCKARWYVLLNDDVENRVMPVFRAERRASKLKKKNRKRSLAKRGTGA